MTLYKKLPKNEQQYKLKDFWRGTKLQWFTIQSNNIVSDERIFQNSEILQ